MVPECEIVLERESIWVLQRTGGKEICEYGGFQAMSAHN